MPIYPTGGGSGRIPQLPEQVDNVAITRGTLSFTLTWSNPKDDENSSYVGVKIVRKEGSCPNRVSDGTLVYDGSANEYTDAGLSANTTYYYRFFAYNAKGKCQNSMRFVYDTAITEQTYAVYSVNTNTVYGDYYERAYSGSSTYDISSNQTTTAYQSYSFSAQNGYSGVGATGKGYTDLAGLYAVYTDNVSQYSSYTKVSSSVARWTLTHVTACDRYSTTTYSKGSTYYGEETLPSDFQAIQTAADGTWTIGTGTTSNGYGTYYFELP